MANKRYIGKFLSSEFTHRKTGTPVKRFYIHLPKEIVEDNRFVLKPDDQVLIEINDDGRITLEKL